MFHDLHPFFADHPVLLAPMAGVTDEAFRTLCAEQGACLCYTEMVSSKALSYANEKTRHLLALAPGEELVAVQLFGHEPDTMAQQAAWVEEVLGERLAYLDINMGCPARKIAGKGDGSALMKNPEQSCARAGHGQVPSRLDGRGRDRGRIRARDGACGRFRRHGARALCAAVLPRSC